MLQKMNKNVLGEETKLDVIKNLNFYRKCPNETFSKNIRINNIRMHTQ